ncbi:ABC transporter permease subunit [uncultured Actinomyces sp.]|uniref:ABC transporter permease subunit n=1 Tax=uncultured Actinomyces sp. TaxID=249061 RepID=UPI0028ED5C96|nr:ABC transporter permease subunit [uncultured Actinomyces sp.]
MSLRALGCAGLGPVVPLTVGAIPFYARLTESAVGGVEHGKVEAALMMGASGRQVTWGVLVREALPALIQGGTVTLITLIGYSAMAGVVGGGGLGDLAIRYGYQRYMTDVMVMTVVLIVLIVAVIQLVGDMLSRLVDHR